MYRLQPIVEQNIKRLLAKEKLVRSLVQKYGSPLNILFPNNMTSNIAGFNAIFSKHDLDGKIFYAFKPNKSKVFAKQALLSNSNIDVSSLQELENALSVGFTPEQMEVTGPKTEKLLAKALQLNILINIDSLSELEKIIRLQASGYSKAKVLLRVSNFTQIAEQRNSFDRFGIEYSSLPQAIETLQRSDTVILKGLSFHSNKSNDLKERVKIIEILVKQLINLQVQGFSECNVLNIGGGYPINYVESKEDWENFLIFLKQSLKANKRVSFNGSTYGFKYDGQAIKGVPSFKEFYEANPKDASLDRILATTLPNLENRTVGQILSENMIELWIEPGKALLDQCGITVSRVIEKKSLANSKILVLEMNYSNLHSTSNELMCDPIVIKSSDDKAIDLEGYFAVGNLCSELDIITNHLFYLDKKTEAGDLIAYINTAPYRMDFTESTPLQNPIASKVVWHKEEIISEETFLHI